VVWYFDKDNVIATDQQNNIPENPTMFGNFVAVVEVEVDVVAVAVAVEEEDCCCSRIRRSLLLNPNRRSIPYNPITPNVVNAKNEHVHKKSGIVPIVLAALPLAVLPLSKDSPKLIKDIMFSPKCQISKCAKFPLKALPKSLLPPLLPPPLVFMFLTT